MAWFAHREDGWEAESERTLAAQGIPVERSRAHADDLRFGLTLRGVLVIESRAC
jgi:hypothetical protein